MKIEQIEKFTWEDIFKGFLLSLLVFLFIYGFIFAIFGVEFMFIQENQALSVDDKLNILNYYPLFIFISVFFSLIGVIFSKFKSILKYSCIVCGKEEYEDSEKIILVNKKEVEKDYSPRIVCKSHKKPYKMNIPLTWGDGR